MRLSSLDTPAAPAAPAKSYTTLNAVGRFWSTQRGVETLVEPDGWREALALAESTLRQHPPRSLLVSGEPLVGKTSFLRLLAQRLAADGWSVFEASGADLQADQVYIGQLEGRIRQVVDELAKGPQADLVHPRHRAARHERHGIPARARPCSTRSCRRSPPAG